MLVFIQFCVSSVFCSQNPDCYLSQAGQAGHSHQFLVHFYFSAVDCQPSGYIGKGYGKISFISFAAEKGSVSVTLIHTGVGFKTFWGDFCSQK